MVGKWEWNCSSHD